MKVSLIIGLCLSYITAAYYGESWRTDPAHPFSVSSPYFNSVDYYRRRGAWSRFGNPLITPYSRLYGSAYHAAKLNASYSPHAYGPCGQAYAAGASDSARAAAAASSGYSRYSRSISGLAPSYCDEPMLSPFSDPPLY
ncbi:hypothetical protein NEAUS04_1686 [Nematocida ausubeli]|uniref:Uncharacterized protein n=1 Tax=Nematocida ausubeli (strain ATCC PRA-371 / ERTm2) TaxID=1913371 RepID=A0A086J5E8_NEMA1|nr:uncharacterized protein NESG_00444 [Nematocida ausubeli]KAI5136839.1 hypothetical protein NEAUS07_1725 [Nematocida ausubeli]KAI5149468.1 hypothetical protein NEAUS05_1787 [Nematocida ausubeli]KAI5163592.1 hypothetical protein NEAUS04_1686 [Nematocida ausubeli]KFG27366.1 hypothetical protein NESG_00444 [Nematocida ausubeli]